MSHFWLGFISSFLGYTVTFFVWFLINQRKKP